jgi:hypothetical protein
MLLLRPAVTAVALLLMSSGFSPAQSLAEIARKEAERRKAIKTPGRVYTNADLKRYPEAEKPSPAAPEAAQAETPVPAPPAEPVEAERRDEAYWRERITRARDELSRSGMFAEALQSRINALTTDFVNRDDPYQRALVAADRQKALAELERVTSEIQRFKEQIAGIEEEARKAGVPAGWLR